MITLSFLSSLAAQAGTMMKLGFSHVAKAQSVWKEDDTPVTETDIAINTLVLDAFKERYPGVCVIAEEGSCIVEGAEWLVYCDPIDGTFPYAIGAPLSTFCISVLKNGVPMLAVIYDPFLDRMYTAERGRGAFMNGIPLKVSDQAVLESKAHVHLIWWKGSKDFSPLCDKLTKRGVACMNFCTIGLIGGLIAAGQFEASVFPGTKVWETAAMSLLVEEAGGRCTDLAGNPIDYLNNGGMNGHVISNGLVHEDLLKLINE
jgi:myo-inositol-1(or 4)-monophosphatase